MQNQSPLIREQAVQIISNNLQQYSQANNYLIKLADDPSPRVRFYTAIALGNMNDSSNIKALAKIAAIDGDDKWTRAAVLSGISGRTQEFITNFRAIPTSNIKATAAVMQNLGGVLGNSGSIAACRSFFKSLLTPDSLASWKVSALLGLTESLYNRKQELDPSEKGFLYAINGRHDISKLDQMIEKLKEHARQQTNEQQLTAIGLLGFSSFNQSGNLLSELLNARNPTEIQIRAINSLTKLQDSRGAELLTEKNRWKAYSPKVKTAAIESLVSNSEFLPTLFQAIQEKNILAAEISSLDRARLIKSENSKISTKATELFKDLEDGNRMAVYQSYKEALKNPGNAKAGVALFKTNCSACHTYAGKGGNVGPDLSGVKNQPADALLLHILVPNYEVYPTYQAVIVKKNDGGSASGWVVSETENSITIRTASGADEAILRKN
ncbi:MAG: HEAT repeat domain-containing protein, partial [Sphingobacterium sp.]